MDDNKMFDLLEKIYAEVQETKKVFKNLENRLDSLENEVKKSGVKIEEKLIPTNVALLEGYKGNAKHITIIDDKIDRLQIDVNSISMKVSYNNKITSFIKLN